MSNGTTRKPRVTKAAAAKEAADRVLYALGASVVLNLLLLGWLWTH